MRLRKAGRGATTKCRKARKVGGWRPPTSPACPLCPLKGASPPLRGGEIVQARRQPPPPATPPLRGGRDGHGGTPGQGEGPKCGTARKVGGWRPPTSPACPLCPLKGASPPLRGGEIVRRAPPAAASGYSPIAWRRDGHAERQGRGRARNAERRGKWGAGAPLHPPLPSLPPEGGISPTSWGRDSSARAPSIPPVRRRRAPAPSRGHTCPGGPRWRACSGAGTPAAPRGRSPACRATSSAAAPGGRARTSS